MTTQGRPPSEPTRSGPAGASSSTPGMTDKVQDTASRVVGSVQETTRPVVDRASETAQQVAEQATEQVTSRLDMAVDYAAESLTGVAQALRQTGQQLRQEGSQPALGRYADSGAQQVERLSGYLRQRNATELLSEVETYARRNPMTFAGGAFALGLMAARFFRATGHRPPPPPPARPRLPYTAVSVGAPRTSPTAAVPRYGSAEGLATSTPPSYAHTAPATPTTPASPNVASPRTGTGASGTGTGTGTSDTGREAERLTPVPGSQSAAGGLGSSGTPSTTGGASPAGSPSSTGGGTGSPGAGPTGQPGTGTPSRDAGTSGGTSPGSGGQRQV